MVLLCMGLGFFPLSAQCILYLLEPSLISIACVRYERLLVIYRYWCMVRYWTPGRNEPSAVTVTWWLLHVPLSEGVVSAARSNAHTGRPRSWQHRPTAQRPGLVSQARNAASMMIFSNSRKREELCPWIQPQVGAVRVLGMGSSSDSRKS